MIFKIILCNQSEDQLQDARVHCVVLKVRAVPLIPSPTGETTKGPEVQFDPKAGPVPQDPTACRHRNPAPRRSCSKLRTDPRSTLDAMSNVPPMSSQRTTCGFDLGSGSPKTSDAP
jgi:hypothetical protein